MAAAGSRDSFADDGVNLNRAFVDQAGKIPSLAGITHRIAALVRDCIWLQVHVVIDLHAGGEVARFAPCASFHPIDDPEQGHRLGGEPCPIQAGVDGIAVAQAWRARVEQEQPIPGGGPGAALAHPLKRQQGTPRDPGLHANSPPACGSFFRSSSLIPIEPLVM